MASENPQNLPTLSERLARIEEHLSHWKDYKSLWPPLPESKVRELEDKHQLTLPEDYRAYITTVADGGPGPLLHFEEAIKYVNDSGGMSLIQTCRLHPDGEYWAEWGNLAKRDYNCYGILPLFESDYGEAIGLVVTGAAKGRILSYSRYNYRLPWFADETSFVDFYLRWRDDWRNRRPNVTGSFETCPDVELMFRQCSEEELLATASMKSPEPASVRALQLLARIGPTERSLPLVHEAMADPRPLVRSTTTPVLEKLKANSELLTLLNDDDASVRVAAVYAIQNLLGHRYFKVSKKQKVFNKWIGALRTLFNKNEYEESDVADAPSFTRFDEALIDRIQIESVSRIYSLIVDTLEYRGKLTPELILAPTAAHPDVRYYAASFLRYIDIDMPQDLTLAVALLYDSDINARDNAIWAFHRWGKPAIAAIQSALQQETDPERKALLEIALKRTRHWLFP
jgi:hypothetical protein